MPTFKRSSTSDCNVTAAAVTDVLKARGDALDSYCSALDPFSEADALFEKKQHLHSFLNVNYFSSEVIRESFVSLLQIEITTLLISYRCQMRQMWSNVN